MDEQTEPDEDIYALLRSVTVSRVKTADSILKANAANALPSPLTPEEIAYWQEELADAKVKLISMLDEHSS